MMLMALFDGRYWDEKENGYPNLFMGCLLENKIRKLERINGFIE